MRYHTTHTLSPNIRETPEGYLVCEGAPIARTGVQEYLPEEVPVLPGPSGVVLVIRAEGEVFSPETIASFEGKSVTIDHPDPAPDPDEPDVNPGNWRELTCGVAMNVRRGAGGEADLLLADLLITDADAIAAVRERRLRQVSCGYDADYEEIRPGVGRQVNITGNHIALVRHGRAGGRVGIKDALPSGRQEGGPGLSRPEGEGCEPGAAPPGEATSPTGSVRAGRADRPSSKKEQHMAQQATGKKKGFWDRFAGHLKKGKTADEAAQAAARDEDQPGQKDEQQPATDNGDAIAALTAKVEELGLMLRTLMEEGAAATDSESGRAADGDSEKTGDDEPDGVTDSDSERTEDEESIDAAGSAKTGDARRGYGRVRVADAAAVRRARTISPGISARVGDSLEATQKFALRRACRDAALKGAVDGFLSGRTIDGLSSAELNAVFCATAELAKHVNNRKTADGLSGVSGAGKTSVRDFGKPATPADVNELNKKFYDKKAG